MTTQEAYAKDAEGAGRWAVQAIVPRKKRTPVDVDTIYFVARWAAHWAALALLLTCMAVRGGWEIHWSPDYRNVGLKLVTECKGKVPFYSVDFVPIETDSDHVTTRRQPTPVGERCTVIVDVEQNADGDVGDPNNDYAADSIIITTED